jgi:hypothetical protein
LDYENKQLNFLDLTINLLLKMVSFHGKFEEWWKELEKTKNEFNPKRGEPF